ncbi:MAG: FAD-dependent monooxygenase [Pseudomonadota bacterium]
MTQTAAIVGAGIGGLTAALALAQRGWTVTVHEQAAAWGEVGAGLQLGPNALRVLKALKVDLQGFGLAPDRVEMRDGPSGRLQAVVRFGPTAHARYGESYLQFHRQDLLGALVAEATKAGVAFKMGTTATPENPPSADLLVAADGVRSTFRAALHPDVAPRFTGQVAWRALVPAERLGPMPKATQLLMGPGLHIVLYPLRNGTLWNLVAVEERDTWTEEGWNRPGDATGLRSAFADWASPVPEVLEQVQEPILWGLFAHGPLPHWSAGNIALLGDACHPMLPFMAQGAAMAIEDAWVLAEAVSAEGIPAGLARYEDLRKPRATRVQNIAQSNARVYHLRSPVMRRMRGLGLGMAQRLPGGLLRRFDWLYGADVTR